MWASGFLCWASGFLCWASGFLCWASGCMCWASGCMCWASGFLCWASGFLCWASGYLCWASGYLLAHIEHGRDRKIYHQVAFFNFKHWASKYQNNSSGPATNIHSQWSIYMYNMKNSGDD